MDRNISRDVHVHSAKYMNMNEGEQESDFILRLFDAYYDRVFCFARKSAHTEVAEDVSQEVFIRLLEHPRLTELHISCSYLIKIAHNLLRRRHARWLKLQDILNCRIAESPSLRGKAEATSEDLPEINLKAAMCILKPEERDALNLIICRGMSYEQAAKSLNTTITTINNRKYRGIQKLKKWQQDQAVLKKHA